MAAERLGRQWGAYTEGITLGSVFCLLIHAPGVRTIQQHTEQSALLSYSIKIAPKPKGLLPRKQRKLHFNSAENVWGTFPMRLQVGANVQPTLTARGFPSRCA